MLRLVGFPDPQKALKTYPFELSGGLRQRVMIAMALVCRPSLLIADEPTTALDVTIQAMILKLMSDLQKELGMALLLITHDLGVVAEMCDTVAVMYAGSVVEFATVHELFKNPKHPYTVGLMNSIPKLHSDRLVPIDGQPPSLTGLPKGCRFADRCQMREEICEQSVPPLEEKSAGHVARCFLV